MSTMRRAVVKTGGVGGPVSGAGPGGQQASGGRTMTATGKSTTGTPGLTSGLVTALPYRVGRAPGGTGSGGHPFLDFSRPQSWRNVGALVAAAYVTGFHVSVRGIRLRAPVPHGHAFALGIYIAAWVYLWKYGADVVAASYTDKPAAAVLHQAF